MIENITCQLSPSDQFFNLLSLFITVFSSLVIGVFIVFFTNYVNRLNEFNALSEILDDDLSHLIGKLWELKGQIDWQLDQFEKIPFEVRDKKFKYYKKDFPSLSFNAFDEFLSKGYYNFISKEDFTNLKYFKYSIGEISRLKDEYDQTQELMTSNHLSLEAYNGEIYEILKLMSDVIYELHKRYNTSSKLKYNSILKRILNRLKTKKLHA